MTITVIPFSLRVNKYNIASFRKIALARTWRAT